MEFTSGIGIIYFIFRRYKSFSDSRWTAKNNSIFEACKKNRFGQKLRKNYEI